jgi:TATA-box binding protein (TBP) (component of TFIID and TFIIIB)
VSRCLETQTTNSIFSSGKVVVGGAKTVGVALMSAHLLAWRLHRDFNLHNADVINFALRNVVTSFGLGYRLDIERLTSDNALKSVWTPEEFRGTTWKQFGVSFVLFETGMAVVTGSPKFEVLREASEKAKVILANYRAEANKPSTRISRGPTERDLYPIATRRKKTRNKSYKKHEEDYIKRLREKDNAQRRKSLSGAGSSFSGSSSSSSSSATGQTETKKKRKRKDSSGTAASARNKRSKKGSATPASTTSTSNEERSFRWKGVDSTAHMFVQEQAQIQQERPTQTMMISAPDLLLPAFRMRK